MPTPVAAARQCLTQEAASALDQALSLANRRGHAQTTSLHMVSSLLSLPRSPLREACTRTRNNAYSTRVQFKALELSLNVSLDRLPSSQGTKVEEPPVSNSLMAAIKRSQAHQRRQPENFTFYQQQQQQHYASGSSSIPVVKVELQNLILSILDDPLVSRVFGEAGFRSYDIKVAMLTPGNSSHSLHLYGYSSRYRRSVPPLFLCNLNGSDSSNTDVGGKGFNFPFMGCFSGEENSRRIGDIMLRDNKRCPLLLGVSAADALKSFLEAVQRKISGVLPEALNDLSMVCIKDSILRYLNGDYDKWSLDLKLDEVERMVENCTGPGVVLSLGDLNALAGDGVTIDGLKYLVGKLSKLLKRKTWLIGTAATHEVYSKILDKCPNIEKDWDLEILPITSQKFSMGGTYPRSSLMGSFVPLGGFFSMPYEMQSPVSNAGPIARCHHCNEKCDQEIAALSNGRLCPSVAERCQSSLPSWLQSAEPSGQSSTKGIDDSVLLNARITGIQKKWESICQKHHINQPFPKGFSHQLGHQLSQAQSFRDEEKKREASDNHRNHSNESSNELGCKNVLSSLSNDLRLSSSQRGLSSSGVLSKVNNQSISSKSAEIQYDSRDDPVSPKPSHFNSSSVSINGDSTSSAPVASVTTDLGLGTASASTSRVADKLVHQSSLNHVQQLSCALSSNQDTFTQCVPNSWTQPSWFSGSNHMYSNVNDPKTLYQALIERVGRQEDAINSIVGAITLCQTKTTSLRGISRRDIWINCQGPDKLGKRKLGVALAEILYGSKDSLIYVDLSFQDEMTPTDTTFNSQLKNKYKLTMRGTVVDYLVEKLFGKPSIVFLENINKADMVVQNSLSQAVKTGRLTDLRGRQVTTSNCMFLVTTGFADGTREIFNEEDIIRAKASSIQMLIRFDLNDDPTSEDARQSDCTLMNKRKLFGQNINRERYGSMAETKRAHKASKSYLDLNVPAEGSEICSPFSGESDSDSSSGNNLMTWLDDFNQQIDQVVVLNPFDFQTLADKLFKDMTKCLQTTVVSECSIEIEQKVMQQLLAAAYLYGQNRVEEWIQQVLGQCFEGAMEKFSLNGSSIVKLVSCEGSASEEQCECLLPGRIVIK